MNKISHVSQFKRKFFSLSGKSDKKLEFSVFRWQSCSIINLNYILVIILYTIMKICFMRKHEEMRNHEDNKEDEEYERFDPSFVNERDRLKHELLILSIKNLSYLNPNLIISCNNLKPLNNNNNNNDSFV
jgi:hypothetical protein